MTERSELKKLKNGSEDALRWFIRRYSGYVATVVHNVIGDSLPEADIEEVVSDVFVALWRSADTVHSPKGFLGTTARNLAKNKARSYNLTLPLDDQILQIEGLTMEDLWERRELSNAVKQAVLQMGQPDRDIFLRFYYYYQSLEEISSQMAIPLSTVKSRLRRGRSKLEKTLSRYFT